MPDRRQRASAPAAMTTWLITVGEPLPLPGSMARPWRTGLLAERLRERGHRVVWWTSTVDHFNKRLHAVGSEPLAVAPGLELRFLHGPLYRKNVSLARLVNHCQVGRRFGRAARTQPVPSVIVCSFPTIELTAAAVRYGRRHAVPVVVDVRDLWPDIFVDVAPRPLRRLSRALLAPYFAAARSALRGAHALCAVSPEYLRWALQRAGRPPRAADRVVPLAYGVPQDGLPSPSEARELLRSFGVSSERITCLFSGTFGRTYDLEPIFAVAADFQSSGRLIQFLICGDGERAHEWRARAAGLHNVIFTGWLDRAQLHAVLVASDLGLAAYAESAPQGIPNKVIEYLAAGLPVVSSLRGECEQLLAAAECGVSYRADDPDSLRQALDKLLNDDTRRQYKARASSLFASRFRAEIVYSEFADHLERISRCGVAAAELTPPENLECRSI